MTEDEIMALAKGEYAEFCKLVVGMPYSKIDEFVNEHDLSYGALSPYDHEDMVDINYKHLCVTVHKREDDLCGVNIYSEVYNENGVPVELCVDLSD